MLKIATISFGNICVMNIIIKNKTPIAIYK